MRTISDWVSILLKCGVRPLTAASWAQVFFDTITLTTFSDGNSDLGPFLAQMLHETANLEEMVENLNYSTQRLMAVWPSRFPTIASALGYANNPEALANKVYGGRMGNVHPGDGWNYRARGVGITGLDSYKLVGNLLGQDLVDVPDLMAQPHYALEGFIAWWEEKIPDSMLSDTKAVTFILNGGQIGLDARKKLTALALSAISQGATA